MSTHLSAQKNNNLSTQLVSDTTTAKKQHPETSADSQQNIDESLANTAQQLENPQNMAEKTYEVSEPSESFSATPNAPSLQGVSSQKPEFGLQILLTSKWMMSDVMDVVAKPIFMLTNMADAGVHGVATGIRALRD